jgi:outer membrane protein assembly factor BamB
VAFALLLAACGGADDAQPTSTSTSSQAPSTQPATVDTGRTPEGGSASTPDPATGADLPSCPAGSSPAAMAHDTATGRPAWVFCSDAKAWREWLGSSETLVYLRSTTEIGAVAPGAAATQPVMLLAVDAATGALRWQHPLPPDRPFGDRGQPPGPFAAAGVVVVPAEDGSGAAIGLDATTGTERWRVAGSDDGPRGTDSGPIANTTGLVIVAGDNTVTGLDRATGTERWTRALRVEDTSQVGVARSPAAVALDRTAGDIVILPAGAPLVRDRTAPREDPTPKTVALDAATGATRWSAPMLQHPTAADGTVIGYRRTELGRPTPEDLAAGRVEPPTTTVHALSATDGSERWSTVGEPLYGDLWTIGEGVVVLVQSGEDSVRIDTVELTSGATRWSNRYPVTATGGFPGAPTAVASKSVFCVGAATIAALETGTGTLHWTAPVPSGAISSSLTADSRRAYVTFNTMPWRD